jgi:hypothetical protein
LAEDGGRDDSGKTGNGSGGRGGFEEFAAGDPVHGLLLTNSPGLKPLAACLDVAEKPVLLKGTASAVPQMLRFECGFSR